MAGREHLPLVRLEGQVVLVTGAGRGVGRTHGLSVMTDVIWISQKVGRTMPRAMRLRRHIRGYPGLFRAL